MENYKITGRAGEGAHGYVLQATDLRTNKTVALKKISINSELGIPKSTMREICALRCLKNKHIVKLFEVTSMGSAVVLVMEFLPCSLQEILKKPLALGQVKTYLKHLLKGVDFMHKNHIMHRDIKPANLLISTQRSLKIGDFGLARIYSEQARQYSHQVATRWYRAPELLYGSRNYTPKVDMWGVGCILGEMIGGAPLFPGETDIEQLAIVLGTLGTPTEDTWPGLTALPDYNKITFVNTPGKKWKNILPAADEATLDLLRKVIVYDGGTRLSAAEALAHWFFVESPRPAKLEEMPDPGDYHVEVPVFEPKEFDEIIEQINNI